MSAEKKMARVLLTISSLAGLSSYGHGWAAELLHEGPAGFCAVVAILHSTLAMATLFGGLFNLYSAFEKEKP